MADGWIQKKTAPKGFDEVTAAKKPKANCSYGEKCYRQKPDHFMEYGHPHLENLIIAIGKGKLSIPKNYKPKISEQTLLEQLKVIRSIKESIENYSNTNISTAPITSRELEETIELKEASESVQSFDSPSSKIISKEVSDGGWLSTKSKECKEFLPCSSKEPPPSPLQFTKTSHGTTEIGEDKRREGDMELPKQLKDSKAEGQNHKKHSHGGIDHEGIDHESLNEDKEKLAKERLIQNLKESGNYRVVVWDRTKIKVKEKLKAAEPYNMFLTVISDSPPTHSEMLSIQFPELLDPSLGDLESSLQINFMIEFGWLLAQYNIMGHNRKPLTVLYGEIDEDLDKFKHFVTHAKVKPPSAFGSHHTKMMIFSYKDGSLRVVVCTANLIESDWDNRTQGLWISPLCQSLPNTSDTGAGESPTFFKRDLLRYLSAYQLPQVQTWIGKVKRADFSAVNVFFIASVPGSHTTDKKNWGQLALAHALNSNVTVPSKNSYQVIVQCSSIGSLGPKPESWLLGDMLNVFCSGKKDGPSSRPSLKFIYPSFENVANSHDGLLGGGCLPYSQKTHAKQEWLTSLMCQWKSDTHHRTRACPHIKSYCRVSPDHSKMSYFVLTSANMSKAAWGYHAKTGSLNILSYEAGVLFLPQFIVVGKNYFPLKKTDESGDTPIFSLPYDLPVTPYQYSDIPWFIENLM